MAVSVYPTDNNITQILDTYTSTAADTITGSAANLVSDSDNKVLNAMFRRGRVKMVNDAEKVSHPIIYGSNEDITFFDPDTIAGTAGNLGTSSFEAVSRQHSTLLAATMNFNLPQADSADTIMDSVLARMEVMGIQVLDSEENLFLRGETSASGTEVQTDCYSGDQNYANSLPMSVLGLLRTGALTATHKFGNLRVTDFPEWAPYYTQVSTAGGGDLLPDLDDAIRHTTYSSIEKPDFVLTTEAVFNGLVAEHRADSVINDRAVTDLGWGSGIPIAGVMVDWSRRLTKDILWDFTGAAQAENPIIGLNTKSLRLNMVGGGGVIGSSLVPGADKAGWLAPVGQTQVHAQLTNIFRRFQYKRNWSVEYGRRSFFHLEGNTQ